MTTMNQTSLFDDSLVLDPARPRTLSKGEIRRLIARMEGSASFGGNGQTYRYLLTRFWGERGWVARVMVCTPCERRRRACSVGERGA